MLLGLLGPLTLIGDDGALLTVPAAPKERAVLEMLALRPARVVRTSELVDALWGEKPPRSASKALQIYISALRRVLPVGAIETSPGGYRLRTDPDAVDVTRFERLVRSGSRAVEEGEPSRGAEHLQEALELWRGEPLVELAGQPSGMAEKARLTELRQGAEELLVDARLALGDHAGLVGDLEAAVAAEPLRERRWAQLMLALYRCGRQADALAAYQRMRRLLGEQLGLDPSEQLAGLERAILVHDASLDVPPPQIVIAAPRAQKGNLPATISSFIGRDHEAREVRKLLDERRLVTVTGVGGAGKTRLGLQVAARLSGAFADGAWFVDLASIADSDEVAGAVAAGLRVRHSSDSPLAEILAEYVAGQALLVVMDNCEHVIDQAALLIERLLAAGSGLKVLATSREPLRITGEAVWPLHPLGLPALDAGVEEVAGSEAVRLFVERARDVDPGLSLDHDALSMIGEIVTLLDGLPLAVELAASLIGVLGLTAIRQRLDDRFALLTKGRRTALPRQQTLAATLDWSYRLLTTDEQALLRRLSVFAGSFDVDAIQAVADQRPNHPGPLAEVVWGLCAKSLLTTISSGRPDRRYRLLDTTRQYAQQRLAQAGEQGQAEAAYLDYYVELAGRAEADLRGPGLAERLISLRADHDNLLRALRLLSADPTGAPGGLRVLTALHRYWLVRGDYAQWLAFAEPLLATADIHISPELHARALAARCFLGSSFDPAGAQPWGKQALEIAQQAHDVRAECEACIALAVNGLFGGRTDPAMAERASALAYQAGDMFLVGQALAASVFAHFDDVPTAIRLSLEALEVLRRSGDSLFEVYTLNNLGVVYDFADDLDQARTCNEQALRVAARLGFGFPIGLSNLGEFLIRQGETAAAAAQLQDALALARRYAPRDVLIAMQPIVGLAVALGEWPRAAQLHGYVATAWVSAGFEGAVATDEFSRQSVDRMRVELGASFHTYYATGASLGSHEAVALAQELTAARLDSALQREGASPPLK
jgi:predicted ATPase/DNA-binding SARP family transcriptional activator